MSNISSVDPVSQDNSVLKSHLSEEQEKTISLAFQQPLTCIIGGPGTGKSLCAARLAHLLIQRNRTADAMRQVQMKSLNSQLMICSATESSLDVITGKICHLGVCFVQLQSCQPLRFFRCILKLRSEWSKLCFFLYFLF